MAFQKSSNFKKKKQDPFANITNPITGEPILDWEAELLKCKEDIKYWINTYVYTVSSKGGRIPFKLFPFQNTTLDAFINERFNIILKSRQMGISVLSSTFAAWMVIFNANKTIGVIANKQFTAGKMLEKIRFVINNLPEWMRIALEVMPSDFEKDRELSLHLKNGSIIEVSATTEDALRGLTLSLLIVDEAAMIEGLEETWKSLFPTLVIGGRAIVLSTPKGTGSFFYKLFKDAESELNDFHPIILGWEKYPGRTKEWAINEIRQNGDKYFKQEYACQFLGSGDTLIPSKWFEYIEANWIDEPMYKGEKQEKGFWYWKQCDPTHRYIVSTDFASGNDDVSQGEGADKSKTDFNTAVVIDMDAKDEEGNPYLDIVAEYCGKIKQPAFAELLYNICLAYNNALWVFENNSGWYITAENYFAEKQYFQIYRQPKNVEKKGYDIHSIDNRQGLNVNKSNRNAITDRLEQLVTTGSLRFHSKRLLSELKTFEYNPKKDRYEAASGNHDDLVMATAIGIYVVSQYLSHRDPTLADMALEAIRFAGNRTMGPNPFAPRQGVLPSISVGNVQKSMDVNPYLDKQTGENIVHFLGGAKQDDAGLQRSIFDFPA